MSGSSFSLPALYITLIFRKMQLFWWLDSCLTESIGRINLALPTTNIICSTSPFIQAFRLQTHRYALIGRRMRSFGEEGLLKPGIFVLDIPRQILFSSARVRKNKPTFSHHFKRHWLRRSNCAFRSSGCYDVVPRPQCLHVARDEAKVGLH